MKTPFSSDAITRLSQLVKFQRNRLKFNRFSTGLFGLDALTKPEGFEKLEQTVYHECTSLIAETTSSTRSRKMVEIFDDLSNSICKVADLAECMRNLHPDPKFIHAAEECMSRLSSFVEHLNTNVELYTTLKNSINDEKHDLTDRRVASLFAFDFEASGVHLPSETRSKFVELSEEIFRAGSAFSRGCESPTEIVVRPRDTSSSHFGPTKRKPDDDDDGPSSRFISGNAADSADPDRRAAGYRLFYAPSDGQEALLTRLIRARHRLALTSDFPTYAHRALRGSILDTPEQAEDFLLKLIALLKPKAEEEIDSLQRYMPNGRPLAIWDLPYLKAMHRRDQLAKSGIESRGLFDIQSTFSGVAAVVRQLYGINLRKESAQSGELWHQDVEKFIAYDENGNSCGTIYCDWFDRPSKTASDSHFTVRCGKNLASGAYQTPVVVLTFRYSRDADDRSSHGFADLTNVLHEFGHAMHSVLGRTRYQHVSGTRCPTDFAEIPSNLMEFYMSDTRTLLTFAKPPSNPASARLNDADKSRLVDSLDSFSSSDTLQQAVYALFDLRLHVGDRPPATTAGDDTVRAFDRLCDECWPLMRAPGAAWHHRFSHLVPYGAKYHAYLVARAAASLIWRRLFVQKPCDRSAGETWRQIQAYGGELPPNELLKMILGKPLDSTDLSKALIAD